MPASPTARRARALVLPPLLALLALTGCASHDGGSGTAPASTGTFPATVSLPGGGPVTIAKRPTKIVSLDPSDTEVLFAIGAGAQVTAVDKDSDYPANAPHSQLDGTNPSIEAIAKDTPDLVITAYNSNNLVAGLQKIKVPVLLVNAPKTIDDAYQVWSAIGRATGHQQQANTLVSNTKSQLAKIVSGTPKPSRPMSYYYELDQTLYTATSHTFIGTLLGQFGLTNIADPADTASSAGYPQLSAERVISSNPTLILLADDRCCGQTAAAVAARPGWGTLDAVRDGNVVALDDDIASRWGPRIVDLLRTVSSAVTKASRENS